MAILSYQYDPKVLLPAIKKRVDILMDTADRLDCGAEWVDCFSVDALIWRNGKESKGKPEIQDMLAESWVNVRSRNHCPEKVFVFSDSEVIVDGHTDYFWESGGAKSGKWAARMRFVEEGGQTKISEYSVVFVFYKEIPAL